MKTTISLFFLLFFVTPAFAVKKTLVLESLKFTAPVNLKALTVKGESKTLFGAVEMTEDGKLISLEARVPVESLTTGMKIRDQHMKERIFTTKEGKLPDLEFRSTKIICEGARCTLAGDFTVMGVVKPVTLICQNEAALNCNGKLSLSDYGIERPSHLGVKVENDVELIIQVKVQ